MQRVLSILIVEVICLSAAFAGEAKKSNTPATSFQVLYNFDNAADGCCLYGGLARDSHGNLFGIAYSGSQLSTTGDVYELARTKKGFAFRVLHAFSSAQGLCISTPSLDSAGNLYGVCHDELNDGGSLWEISASGQYSTLHSFNQLTDGVWPEDAIAFDRDGNIYGTTYDDGPGSGTLWEYSPSSGTFKVLHAFMNLSDGGLLPTGPRIDSHGIIWGTTSAGPNCYFCGTGTVWTYDINTGAFTTVLDFGNSGVNDPPSRLTLDSAGNLYGTAFGLTQGNCGLVYELQKSNNYAPVILYSFTGKNGDGCEAFSDLVLDSQGNIFGTTYSGGNGSNAGTVFELQFVNGGWQETILHSFNVNDGFRPQSGLVGDGLGNWYGTASAGGKAPGGGGTIFEISGVQ